MDTKGIAIDRGITGRGTDQFSQCPDRGIGNDQYEQ